jgi:Asp-tRNA(Asn)/Glu-tRNA(Gln) amidotransferase A subunit family amidase
VRALKGSDAFERSTRERRKIEMLFAHLKRNLSFRRLGQFTASGCGRDPATMVSSPVARLMAGPFLSAGDYVQAGRRRREMIAAVEGALRKVDILLCASAMDPPSRIDIPEEVERTYPQQARTPFNVTGHPALAMMSGLSSGGLPLSVQFVSRYFAEALPG